MSGHGEVGRNRMTLPEGLAEEVRNQAAGRCCSCRTPGRALDLHHLDGDPTNHDVENLVALCGICGARAEGHDGDGPALDADELAVLRWHWCKQVELLDPARLGTLPDECESELDEATLYVLAELAAFRDNRDHFRRAKMFHELGILGRRDLHVDQAIAGGASAREVVWMRSWQERLDEVDDELWEAAFAEVGPDWTHAALLHQLRGRPEDAVRAYLDGIRQAVDDGNLFQAAFYLKHGLDDDLWRGLLVANLHKEVEADDVWWQFRTLQELGRHEEAGSLLLGNADRIRAEGTPYLQQALADAVEEAEESRRLRRVQLEDYYLGRSTDEDEDR